ncbi:MAG: hypothetical protein Q7S76_00840, partial [bacterium]|nr:hypothetical protein [bacterium]
MSTTGRALVGLLLTGLVFILVSSVVLQFTPREGCEITFSMDGTGIEDCYKQRVRVANFNRFHSMALLTIPYIFLGLYVKKGLGGSQPWVWVLPLIAIVFEKVLMSVF